MVEFALMISCTFSKPLSIFLSSSRMTGAIAWILSYLSQTSSSFAIDLSWAVTRYFTCSYSVDRKLCCLEARSARSLVSLSVRVFSVSSGITACVKVTSGWKSLKSLSSKIVLLFWDETNEESASLILWLKACAFAGT